MVEGFVPPKLTNLLNPSVKPNGLPAPFTMAPEPIHTTLNSAKPLTAPNIIQAGARQRVLQQKNKHLSKKDNGLRGALHKE